MLAMVLFNLGLLALGHLMGGPDRCHAAVLELAPASRHPPLPGRHHPLTEHRVAAAVVRALIVNAVVCPPVPRLAATPCRTRN